MQQSRQLGQRRDDVRCFGDQQAIDGRLKEWGYPEPEGMTAPEYLRPVFGAMGRDIAWAATDVDADRENVALVGGLGADAAQMLVEQVGEFGALALVTGRRRQTVSSTV